MWAVPVTRICKEEKLGLSEIKEKNRRRGTEAAEEVLQPDEVIWVVSETFIGASPIWTLSGFAGLLMRPHFIAVTDKRVLVFKESIFGRPKGKPLSADRQAVQCVGDLTVVGWRSLWLRFPDGHARRMNFNRMWKEEASSVADLVM